MSCYISRRGAESAEFKRISRLIQSLPLAYNFFMTSHICFRYWEFWSLGGLEDFYNFLRNSESPNLPAAKAIKVILMFIPVRSAGGGLSPNWEKAQIDS